MTLPVPKSKTRRRDSITAARQSLAKWQNLMAAAQWSSSDKDPQAQVARVRALLWAQARIERALWLETRGLLGDQFSTPGKIVQRAGGVQGPDGSVSRAS